MRNDPKIIVAAGAFRSGSTWLFNAIRLVLSQKSKSVYSCWVDDFDAAKAEGCEYLLIKIHHSSEEWRSKARWIFTIHRDLRDVARSAIDFLSAQGADEIMHYVRICAKDHDFWKKCCQSDYRYEDILTNSNKLICDIAISLEIPLGEHQISCIADQLANMNEPAGKNNYDPVTLLHPRHKFGGQKSNWSQRLSDEQADMIMKEFSSWMRDRGYR